MVRTAQPHAAILLWLRQQIALVRNGLRIGDDGLEVGRTPKPAAVLLAVVGVA